MGDLASLAFVAKLSPNSPAPGSRTIAYAYDGLLRLTGAVERPGESFEYLYDKAGNRI